MRGELCRLGVVVQRVLSDGSVVLRGLFGPDFGADDRRIDWIEPLGGGERAGPSECGRLGRRDGRALRSIGTLGPAGYHSLNSGPRQQTYGRSETGPFTWPLLALEVCRRHRSPIRLRWQLGGNFSPPKRGKRGKRGFRGASQPHACVAVPACPYPMGSPVAGFDAVPVRLESGNRNQALEWTAMATR